MKLVFSPNATRGIKKLSQPILKKLYKQTSFLLSNPSHPSLRTKKLWDWIDLKQELTIIIDSHIL